MNSDQIRFRVRFVAAVGHGTAWTDLGTNRWRREEGRDRGEEKRGEESERVRVRGGMGRGGVV